MHLTGDLFARLPPGDFEVHSPKTPAYNALAWAIGGETEKGRWWSPDRGEIYFWPHGIERRESLETYLKVFYRHGFEDCGLDDAIEPGYEKVAIYCKGERPVHFARQLEDGRWTSKLGQSHDIIHLALSCLSGEDKYGTVQRVVKRPNQPRLPL